MKLSPRRPDATVFLWFASALAWIGLGIAVFHQVGVLAWRPAGALPEIKALVPRPLRPAPAAADIGKGNPFDPSAGRWLAAAPEQGRASSDVHGVLLLPGVRAAVTAGGPVHVGEAFGGGRLIGIQGGKLQVRKGGGVAGGGVAAQSGVQEFEVPALRSPTLKSLNSAPPQIPARSQPANVGR